MPNVNLLREAIEVDLRDAFPSGSSEDAFKNRNIRANRTKASKVEYQSDAAHYDVVVKTALSHNGSNLVTYTSSYLIAPRYSKKTFINHFVMP